MVRLYTLELDHCRGIATLYKYVAHRGLHENLACLTRYSSVP